MGRSAINPSPRSPTLRDRHIGQRIRCRRWQIGLSQSYVGGVLGVKYQQVQKYETGASRIAASRLWDLAALLGVQIGYFYEGL